MTHIYLLQHTYFYGENKEYEETKIIGIYDSNIKAEKAKAKYSKLPGFKDFSKECFSIDKYQLNVGEWTEGFVRTT